MSGESPQETADKKFEASRMKFQEAAKKHLDSVDVELSDEEEDEISDTVLGELFKSYSRDAGTPLCFVRWATRWNLCNIALMINNCFHA